MNGYKRAQANIMGTLLLDMPAGVPADCLLARLRGRRSFLVRDWDRLLLTGSPLQTLSPAPWRQTLPGTESQALQALQQEYFWVFSRMDGQLRRFMAPFFWLAEVRTLSVCLRLLSRGAAKLDRLLTYSLLASTIKVLLRKADGCAPAVTGLTALLAGYDARFSKVGDIYLTGGSGALEAALHEISLAIISHMPLHPQMRRYIALVIDSRNLTTVAKRLRWQLGSIPPLLEGGTLPPPRLAKLFELKDNAGLLQLAMYLGGLAPYRETDDLERVLYEAQRRVIRRLARGADGVGVILDYLWRCGNEAANIGLLERLESMGSEHAEAELRR